MTGPSHDPHTQRCRPRPLRIVMPLASPGPQGSGRRPCEYEGCDRAASGGKPYCGDHLHHIPYAAELFRREAELTAEQKEKLE